MGLKLNNPKVKNCMLYQLTQPGAPGKRKLLIGT